jgi:hypothetical protein
MIYNLKLTKGFCIMKLKNFTPHEVTIYYEGSMFVLPSIGVARASEVCIESEAINGIPTVAKRYDTIINLPEQCDGVIYIVSLPVLQASDRSDLVCPDTGPDSVVRDKDGKIIGVRRFQRRQVDTAMAVIEICGNCSMGTQCQYYDYPSFVCKYNEMRVKS